MYGTNLFPTYRMPKPIQPLQPPQYRVKKLPQPVITGRPTLPILGAPRMPANPLLAQFMKVHRHQLIKR